MIFRQAWLIIILSGILAYSNAQDRKKITIDELKNKLNPTLNNNSTNIDLQNIETESGPEVSDITSTTQLRRQLNFTGSILRNLRFIGFTNIMGLFRYGTFTNITFINTQTEPLQFNGATINGMEINGGEIIFEFDDYANVRVTGLIVRKNSQLTVLRAYAANLAHGVTNFDITAYGNISYSDFSYAALNFKGDAEDTSFNMNDTNFTGSTGAFQIMGTGNEIRRPNLTNSMFSAVIWKNLTAVNWRLSGIMWENATLLNVTGNRILADNATIKAGRAVDTTLTFKPGAKTHFHMNVYNSSYYYTGDNNEVDVSSSTMQGSKIITGSSEGGEGSGLLNMDGVTIVHTRDQNDPVEVSPTALHEAVLTTMMIGPNAILVIGGNGANTTVDTVDLTGTEIQQGGQIILRNMNIGTLDLTRLNGEGTLILQNVTLRTVIGANLQAGANIAGTLTIEVIDSTIIGALQLGAALAGGGRPQPNITVDAANAHFGGVNFAAGPSGPPSGLRSSADGIQTNIDCNTANYVLYPSKTWCYKRND